MTGGQAEGRVSNVPIHAAATYSTSGVGRHGEKGQDDLRDAEMSIAIRDRDVQDVDAGESPLRPRVNWISATLSETLGEVCKS
jgi:hypothetical protein